MTPLTTIQMALISGGIALVVGLSGGAWAAHAWYVPQLKSAKAELDVEKGKVEALGVKIDDQNTAIDTLTKTAAERAKRAAEALKSAQANRDAAQQAVGSLLAQKLPPGADACVEASALIRKELAK